MKVRIKLWTLACALALFAANSVAETFYELGLGAGQHALKLTRDQVRLFRDESRVVIGHVAAYRSVSDRAAWGGVIELMLPVDRDEAIPGTGRIIGFRPINYLRAFGAGITVEGYGGIAQYDYNRKNNGYYVGLNLRYETGIKGLGAGVDVKYNQDLSADAVGDDDIVDGFSSSLKLYYRFQ